MCRDPFGGLLRRAVVCFLVLPLPSRPIHRWDSSEESSFLSSARGEQGTPPLPRRLLRFSPWRSMVYQAHELSVNVTMRSACHRPWWPLNSVPFRSASHRSETGRRHPSALFRLDTEASAIFPRSPSSSALASSSSRASASACFRQHFGHLPSASLCIRGYSRPQWHCSSA